MIMVQQKQSIGLIAGNGRFPILFALAARRQGFRVFVLAIKGNASPLLHFCVDGLAWIGVSDVRSGFDYFKAKGVTQVIMAGQISQRTLFDARMKSDLELQKFLSALEDRKADTIFSAVTDILTKAGLEVLDSTFLLKQFLAPRGTLTKRGPTEGELADIEFGRTIAKAMGGLDVGQTVVIKSKAIVAIEAMEGTDRCIIRGGRIAHQGAVVIKASKPQQDARFDVPVVGPKTIRSMKKSNCKCLAIEAERTLVLDYEKTLRLADLAGICVVSN